MFLESNNPVLVYIGPINRARGWHTCGAPIQRTLTIGGTKVSKARLERGTMKIGNHINRHLGVSKNKKLEKIILNLKGKVFA